jgi:hypothetical protein
MDVFSIETLPRRTPMTRTCTIRYNGYAYYLGHGATRSRSEYKTFKNALLAAARQSYTVENQTDPRIAYEANENRTKIVTNLISGRLVRIPVNTPLCCDPSSETYWSM